MKKPIISVIIIILVLAAVCASAAYAFFDEKTVSESENRTLFSMPELTVSSWFSGDFAEGFQSFLSDHVLNRNSFITAAAKIEDAFAADADIKIVTHAADMGVDAAKETERTENTVKPVQTEEKETKQPQNLLNIKETESGQDYIILKDRIMQLFDFKPETCDRYAAAVNEIFSNVPNSIAKYNMIVPQAISFDDKYKDYCDDVAPAIEYTAKQLDPLITSVDAYSSLLPHADENIYFRTDHHWTHLGAYYGAKQFFETAGKEYIPIGEYEKREGNPFAGYLSAQNPSSGIDAYPDELTYYIYGDDICSEVVYEYENETDKEPTSFEQKVIDPERKGYYTFVASSYAYVVIDGKKDDNSCLIMIADSYGNAIGSWLADNYSKVIIVDARYFKDGKKGLSELMSKYGATDFMILNYSSVLEFPYYASRLEELAK